MDEWDEFANQLIHDIITSPHPRLRGMSFLANWVVYFTDSIKQLPGVSPPHVRQSNKAQFQIQFTYRDRTFRARFDHDLRTGLSPHGGVSIVEMLGTSIDATVLSVTSQQQARALLNSLQSKLDSFIGII